MPKHTKESHEIISKLIKESYDSRGTSIKRSISLAEEALALSIDLNNEPLIADCYSKLSLFKMIQGEYDESLKIGKQALTIYEGLNNEIGIADVKYNIAGVFYKTDNYHQGLIYLIDCLEIYRKYENFHNISRVSKSLGTIYEYFGDEKSAIISYQKAIEAAEQIKDENLSSNALNPLSGIYINHGEIKKAEETIQQSITYKKKNNDIRGLAFAFYGLAKVYVAQKNYEKAEEFFLESEKIHIAQGERLGVGMCYYKMGCMYHEQKKYEKAIQSLNDALTVAEKYNTMLVKFKAQYKLYEIYKANGKMSKALNYLEQYVANKNAVINTQTQKVIESYEAITKMKTLQQEAQLQKEKAEIIEKKNKVEQSSKIKQDFLSTMSHEIRTPLNAVITISSLLKEPQDLEDKKLLNSLKFSANALMYIINDILDYSKLDAGKVSINSRSCNIRHLIENIRNTYASSAEKKEISLNLHIAKELKAFYQLDDTKFTQILGNLISNAIKFTDDGKVDVYVDLLEEGDADDLILFRVTDTGIGVPDDFIDSIFDSFTQSQHHITKKYTGSGLGLAIVQKLVQLHGSEVKVRSAEGKGSDFYFEINIPHGNITETINDMEGDGLKDKTILLAEDNMINAMVSMKLLTDWGIKTYHAKNGKEAVALAENIELDYILMDIHMPLMDGYQAAREIRHARNKNATVPIIALTADITANEQDIFTPYFDDFLLKPINRKKLFDTLIIFKNNQ